MHMVARAGGFIVVAMMMACSQIGGKTESDPERQARADALFAQLKSSQDSGDFASAAAASSGLITGYPDYPAMDEVKYRAGEIALQQNEVGTAVTLFDAVARDYELSAFRPRALRASATGYERLQMPDSAAVRLSLLLDTPLEPAGRDEALSSLRSVITELGPAQRAALARRFPGSPVTRETSLEAARTAYANGQYDAAYDLLSKYLYEFPQADGAGEAQRLLSLVAERRGAPHEGPPTRVDPNTIGVLTPVTGPAALYGRFFEQGVKMAVDEFNATSARRVRIVTANSKGAPVDAVKATRKLIQEDGAVMLLGSVFSVPTMSAAIEANAWRVSFVSPVVSTADLVEIGPWVYHTRIPRTVEVTAVAQAAVGNLLLERFAVIAPRSGEGRRLGDFFADEITRLGGEVVAQEYYDEGSTDFREQLEAARESAPDAIFAPGSVEELMNFIPQVKFYDMQLQLLGLSDWNNEKLLRLSRDDLEGALFPREAFHGRSDQAYRNFESKMKEQGVGEPNPIAMAGYFGARVALGAFAAGASTRDEVRAYLDGQLRGDAASRAQQAAELPLLVVRRGKPRDFDPPRTRQ